MTGGSYKDNFLPRAAPQSFITWGKFRSLARAFLKDTWQMFSLFLSYHPWILCILKGIPRRHLTRPSKLRVNQSVRVPIYRGLRTSFAPGPGRASCGLVCLSWEQQGVERHNRLHFSCLLKWAYKAKNASWYLHPSTLEFQSRTYFFPLHLNFIIKSLVLKFSYF